MDTTTEKHETNGSISETVLESTQVYNDLLKIFKKTGTADLLQEELYTKDEEIIKNLENLVILNNNYLKQTIGMLEKTNTFKAENDQLREKKQQLEQRCEQLGKDLNTAKNHYKKLKMSKSFMIGRAFVEGFKRPGVKTLMIPYKLIRIILSSPDKR